MVPASLTGRRRTRFIWRSRGRLSKPPPALEFLLTSEPAARGRILAICAASSCDPSPCAASPKEKPPCRPVRAPSWRALRDFSGADVWLQASRVPRDGVARPSGEGYADRLYGTLVF